MAATRGGFEDRPSDDGDDTLGTLISDSELEQAALAADPDAPIPHDARPFMTDEHEHNLLPAWYMPVPRHLRRTPARRIVVAGIVVSLLIVNGAGLCVTYGWPEIAW